MLASSEIGLECCCPNPLSKCECTSFSNDRLAVFDTQGNKEFIPLSFYEQPLRVNFNSIIRRDKRQSIYQLDLPTASSKHFPISLNFKYS